MTNIIIIGTGNFARQHAKCIREINNLNLAGFVGSNKAIGEEFSVPVYGSIEEVKNLDFEKAVIVNRNDKHFDSIVKLIALKKDILCEKPVVISEKQMDLLDEELAGYNGRFHVVGQRKYDEWIDYLKSEKIQKIFGNIANAHLFCSFNKNKEYYETWRADVNKAGGGILIHNAIHYLGMLNHLLGKPIEVKGTLIYHDEIGSYETGMKGNVRYENNIDATVDIGTNPDSVGVFELHLKFEKGKVVIRDTKVVDVSVEGNKINNLKMKYLLLRRFKTGSLLDQYNDFLENESSDINTYNKAKNDLKIIFDLYNKKD